MPFGANSSGLYMPTPGGRITPTRDRFESKNGVDRFIEDLRVRFARFGLTLNEDKTHVLQFGRFAAQARARRGACKAADVRLPGVHPLLRVVPVERLVPTEAADLGEANARQPQGDSTGADASHARPDPRGRSLTAARGPGLLQLPRRPRQRVLLTPTEN
jgi:hypothetical protein